MPNQRMGPTTSSSASCTPRIPMGCWSSSVWRSVEPDMRRLLIFLFLTTFFAADGQLLPIRNYTMREGLNASSISALLRDSKGMLWVGTYNGVNLYDGQRFQQPQISTRSGQIYVTQFAEDRKGQIWAGSWYSGLYKYAGGVFTNYL